VILINASNDIICKSTLDVRVQQGFADYLPDIRERLFAVQPNA
jgi:hypothetical protein